MVAPNLPDHEGTEQNNAVIQNVVNANGVTVVNFDKERSTCRGNQSQP
jgi:hypothetical protein